MMDLQAENELLKKLERIADALERIADCLEEHILIPALEDEWDATFQH